MDAEKNHARLEYVADEMRETIAALKRQEMAVDVAQAIVAAGHTIVQSVKAQIQVAMLLGLAGGTSRLIPTKQPAKPINKRAAA